MAQSQVESDERSDPSTIQTKKKTTYPNNTDRVKGSSDQPIFYFQKKGRDNQTTLSKSKMISKTLTVISTLLPSIHGFLTPFPELSRPNQPVPLQPTPALRMSDFDFPSAMPEKPKLTLDESIAQSADNTIEVISNALGPGVSAPPELEALKEGEIQT